MATLLVWARPNSMKPAVAVVKTLCCLTLAGRVTPVHCPRINPSQTSKLPIPDSFIRAYPEGSQTRKIQDITSAFKHDAAAYYKIFGQYRRENACFSDEPSYKLEVAIAIDPAGHVVGDELVRSSVSEPELEARVLERIRLMNFGPAAGDGNYVIEWPIYYAASR